MSDTQLPNIGMVSTTEIEDLNIRYAKGEPRQGARFCSRLPGQRASTLFIGSYAYLGKNIPTWPLTFPATGFPTAGGMHCRPRLACDVRGHQWIPETENRHNPSKKMPINSLEQGRR